MVIGSYETLNFDVCPSLEGKFSSFVQRDDVDLADIEKAARRIDAACGIFKLAKAVGHITSAAFDEVVNHVDAADTLLSLAGIDDVDFLYDDLEGPVSDLWGMEDVDTSDHAHDVAHIEAALFPKVEGADDE